MTDAEKREKVMRGLEAHVNPKVCETCAGEDCPYYNSGGIYPERSCSSFLAADALALLKEQEARVMTLEELRDVGRVWKSSAPPFLWLDKNRSIYNSIGFWCPWRDIYEMIHGRHDKYTDENYGSAWRCWTSRPSEQQMRDTPWE